MSFPKRPAFLIDCSTGCSCCADENHTRGPFKLREDAEAKAISYRERRLLASQFSSTGVYYIREVEAEVLPDGRLIIDNRVCAGFADDTGEEVFSND